MHVLRVTANVYPDQVGGLELHAHHLSRMQAAAGHDVTVLTSDHGDGTRPREERRDGYTVRRHRELARPLDNTVSPGVARSLLECAQRADVLHVHSHLFFVSNLATLIGTRLDVPVVLTNHGLVSQTAPSWLQRPFDRTIGRLTFGAADRVLCYTETDRRRLEERGVETPVSVVHNGVDCESFSPDAGDERRRRVLFVGRLKEGKGPHLLVSAFADVLDAFPEYTLTVVGSGPARAELERRAADLGIGDSVEFAGEVPNDQLAEYYATSDCFALPSFSEGLPRTVLEAMACETPVVTSDLPQLEPLLADAGRTVPVGSVSELAADIRELLACPERRRRLGENGREVVRSDYSWRETVSETTDVLEDVASAAGD